MRILALLFLVHAFAARAQVSAGNQLSQTLACVRAFHDSAGPFHEVFEKSGLTYVRSFQAPQSPGDLDLSLTDGQKLYTVHDKVTGPAGPGAVEHRFRLVLPSASGKKTYCFDATVDSRLQDRSRQMDPSPPAACTGWPVRNAVAVVGEAAQTAALMDFQARLHASLHASVKIAQKYSAKAGTTEETQDRIDALAKFRPDACEKLSPLSGDFKRDLAETRAYQQTRATAAPADSGQATAIPGHQ